MRCMKSMFLMPILFSAALSPLISHAEELPVKFLEPTWKNDLLWKINFSKDGDQRTKDTGEKLKYNLLKFQIPGGSEISGAQFLQLAPAMDYESFERTVLKKNPKEKITRSTRDEIGRLSSTALPLLVMSRILDNEAMKMKISPDVSAIRVNYVARAILLQNAIDVGVIKSKIIDKTR